MFNNPIKPDKYYEEGVVVEVDPQRYVVKAKTANGRFFSNVKCLQPPGGSGRGGQRVMPSLGDFVLIYVGLGYPLIVGSIPKAQSNQERFSDTLIGASTDTIVDTGNFAAGPGVNVTNDANKPKDILSGDNVIQSAGGGVFGVLKGGSILLRSSFGSEVFISKWRNLVRLVSDNFEHFTSLTVDVIKNYRGRTYRYIGYAKDFQESKSNTFRYREYYGDTAIAESVKDNYGVPSIPPVANSTIKKEQVSNAAGAELMKRTLDLVGDEEIVIKNTDGSIYTRIKQTKDDITLSYKGTHTITISTSGVDVVAPNQVKATVGSSTVTVSPSAIDVSATTVNIVGTASITLTAPSVSIP